MSTEPSKSCFLKTAGQILYLIFVVIFWVFLYILPEAGSAQLYCLGGGMCIILFYYYYFIFILFIILLNSIIFRIS